MTITRGGIMAIRGVAEMRAEAIALLKRMYTLNSNVMYWRSVLDVLNTATRRGTGALAPMQPRR